MKKLTNEIVDARLIGRNIKRLDNYIGVHTSVRFQCLINECFHVWNTGPSNIFSGQGCPKCAGNLKLTNEIIDERLIGKNIKRIEDYINCNTPIDFQCLIDICDYVWKTTPASILGGGTGCPKCAGLIKLTNEIIDERLINRNIKRLDDCINAITKIRFQCEIDKCIYIWRATPHQILNKDAGCPKCAGNLKLTNEIIDERLAERDIKRLDDCGNAKKKINFQCTLLNCFYIWSATPDSVLSGSGCPKCHKFRKSERLIFDIFRSNCEIMFYYDYSIRRIDASAKRALRFDFYFPSKKLAIEYNGAQHYEMGFFNHNQSKEESEKNLLNTQDRDRYKQQFCDEHNIKIIWIDGRVYKYKILKQYILEEILPLLK